MNNNYQGYPNRGCAYPASDVSRFLEKSRKELHRHGVTVGVCLLLCLFLQYAVVNMLRLSGLYDEYLNNEVFGKAVDILFSAVTVFLPFLAAVLLMPPKKRELVTPLGSPVSGKLMAAGVAAGLMFCVVGSDITTYLAAFLKNVFGVTISASETVPATSAAGRFLYVCSLSVIPPLSEEFAFRGVVLQPMRKFGDLFAIVMSAFVFGLMHGTALQFPFAFIAGISLAYFTIATGTMWTGIIIHSLNNLLTVIIGLVSEINPDRLAPVYGAINTVILIFGMIAAVYFLVSKKKIRLKKTSVNLSLGVRVRAFLLNPLMIIAFCILVWQISKFIS